MKPQMDNFGKGAWSLFWGDKVKKKLKRIFSKSDRQRSKANTKRELENIAYSGGEMVDAELLNSKKLENPQLNG